MEASQRSVSTIRQTIHFPRTTDGFDDAPYGDQAPRGYTELSSARDASSHKYGVFFDHRIVQFYVDRVPRLSLTREEAVERDRTWPSEKPQYIVLNIAIGVEPPEGVLPATMEVSQISIWEGGVPLL
jgi:hypothetical protein